MPTYPFVPAYWTFQGRRGQPILWVVLHTMESPEGPRTAENVAAWFAKSPAAGGPPKPASAHYCVDQNSIIACVREENRAAGAQGANTNGVHIEMAGRANQTAAQWADFESQATLRNAAKLTADICKRHNIPIGLRVGTELQSRKPGVTGHVFCVQAFGGTHYDPGPHFDWHAFLELVRAVP